MLLGLIAGVILGFVIGSGIVCAMGSRRLPGNQAISTCVWCGKPVNSLHACSPGGVCTISGLQAELPRIWTDERYSGQFRAYSASYRDFDHALKHVTKALGKLTSATEEADHGNERFHKEEVGKYLADLVICSVRAAVKAPCGGIDLERAVIDRINEKR